MTEIDLPASPPESPTSITPFARVAARVASDSAALASLRRGVGRPVEECPAAWPFVTEAAAGESRRELAAHIALGLLALHQQAQTPGAMNRAGWGVGKACRVLGRRRAPEGVDRRFRAALAANDLAALAVHLRGLVTLMRGEVVPLDYSRLYRDLCSWGYPDGRSRVGMQWSRDYIAADRQEGNETDGDNVVRDEE